MRGSVLVGIILIVAFGSLAAWSFTKTVTPYVSVPEARLAHDTVQVYGAIDQSRLRYDRAEQALVFPLTDPKNHTMWVHYRGVRPGNMSQATHCVATGRWSGDHFEANALLIKCPSKYQGEQKT